MWKTLFFLQGNVTCLAVGLIGGLATGLICGIGLESDREKNRNKRVMYSKTFAD